MSLLDEPEARVIREGGADDYATQRRSGASGASPDRRVAHPVEDRGRRRVQSVDRHLSTLPGTVCGMVALPALTPRQPSSCLGDVDLEPKRLQGLLLLLVVKFCKHLHYDFVEEGVLLP